MGVLMLGAQTIHGVDEFGVRWATQRDQFAGFDDSAATSMTVEQRPRAHGAWAGTAYNQAGHLAFGGLVYAGTPEDLLAARDRLKAACSLTNTELVVDREGSVRSMTVRREDAVLFKELTPTTASWSIQLLATDPRKFGVSLSGSTGLPSTSGGLTINASETPQWPASGTSTAIFFGDSISEGTGSSPLNLRWQTLLQGKKRAGVTGATYPFIPAFSTTSTPHPGVTKTGAVFQYDTWGFGGRTALINDTGVVTFTWTGTGCALMFDKASGTGTMNLVLDGGTPVVIDTNSVTNPGTSPALWNPGALSTGTHTLVVTRDASSPVGKSPYVEGLLTYNGDSASGIRIIDAARSGTLSTYFTSGRTTAMAKSLALAGGADLAIIGYGTNDYPYATPVADFKANIELQITALRANGFTGSVLLLGMYLAQGRDPAVWQTYHDQMVAIAAADPLVGYLDLREYMPPVPTPYNDPSSLGYYNDTVHPSNAGHEVIASVISEALTYGTSGGLTVPFTIDATTVSGQVSFTNAGNTPGPVTVRLNGPLTGPVVTHVESGARVAFSPLFTINTGEWVLVDMESHSALAQGQSSRSQWITSRGWSTFSPGGNTWALTATSGTGSMLVTTRPSWQ